MNRRISLHFVAAWLMFLAASVTPFLLGRSGLQPWLDSTPWLRHFIVKTVLVVLAFAAMKYDGRSLRSFGFRSTLAGALVSRSHRVQRAPLRIDAPEPRLDGR